MTTDLSTSAVAAVHGIRGRRRGIGDAARGMADLIDSERRLPPELVELLRDSQLLRACAPTEVGGLELSPGTALRCAEAVARGNASAGWCVSIAMTSSLLVAYLPASSREICSAPAAVSAQGCGRRAAGRGGSLAASWSRGDGRSAAVSATPTCCSSVACSTTNTTPWPCPNLTCRCSTRGTRWACAAPAATIRWPTRCSFRRTACSR